MTAEALTAPPARGRVYLAQRRVRTNDVDTGRRLRLDGVARYLQDIAFDDLADAGFEQVHPLWVLRRTVVDVLRPGSTRTFACAPGARRWTPAGAPSVSPWTAAMAP